MLDFEVIQDNLRKASNVDNVPTKIFSEDKSQV